MLPLLEEVILSLLGPPERRGFEYFIRGEVTVVCGPVKPDTRLVFWWFHCVAGSRAGDLSIPAPGRIALQPLIPSVTFI